MEEALAWAGSWEEYARMRALFKNCPGSLLGRRRTTGYNVRSKKASA